MAKYQSKNLRVKLRKKRKIVKDFLTNKRSVKKLSIDHGVTPQIVRSSLAMSTILEDINSDDPLLEEVYYNVKTDSKTAEIDEYVLDGLKEIRKKSGIVLKHFIKALATEFKENRPDVKVNITDYYINGFKERNNVIWKSLYGESRSACFDKSLDFFAEYNHIKGDYEERNIFNLDETGLYIKNFGNKTYIIKGEDDCKNVKMDKTRVTAVLAFNKFGEEFAPLIIGKSRRPRCFKNGSPEEFGIFYEANENSWLTKEIFKRYLGMINEKYAKENRKILLIMDNFRGHDVTEPSNIKFLFFPANCTSVLQPLDLGIIKAIKDKYKDFLACWITKSLRSTDTTLKSAFSLVTLLDVFFWVRKAIDEMKTDTYLNCWKKAEEMEIKIKGIATESEFDEIIEVDDCEDTEPAFENFDYIEDVIDELDDDRRRESISYHMMKLQKLLSREESGALREFFEFKNKLNKN